MDNKPSVGLRIIDYFMLGLGSMIGVGWTVSLSSWFLESGGAIPTALAFLIGTLAVIPIGLCYGELTSAMPVSGGVMAFAYRSRGSRFSFIGGWVVALAYLVLLPWEIIYVSDLLSILLPFLKAGSPLYSVGGVPIYPLTLLVGIAITAFFLYMNIKGAEISGKVQTQLTVIILAIAALVVLFSVIKINPKNLMPIYSQVPNYPHKNFLTGLISMLVVVPFFLAGFDAIPQAIEDARDEVKPQHISAVIAVTIGAAGLFYILIVLAASSAFPWKDFARLENPGLAFMFQRLYPGFFGKAMYYLTIIGALAGLLSTFNGMFIAASKLLFSMGRAKLLPDFFGKLSQAETPANAILFCGLITLVGPVFGTSVIRPLTNVGSVAFVLGWLITTYSTLELRDSEESLPRPIRAGQNKVIIYFSIAVSLALILLSIIPGSPGYMSHLSLAMLIAWLGLGFLFFALSQNQGEDISEEKRQKLIFQSILGAWTNHTRKASAWLKRPHLFKSKDGKDRKVIDEQDPKDPNEPS